MGEVALAWAALAATTVSTAVSIKQGNAAADDRERAQDEADAQAAGQAASVSRKQARQDRIRRAKILQGAENTGTSGSAGEQGSLSSINTQGAATAGFNANQTQLGQSASGFLQSAAGHDAKAQTAGAVAGFSSSIFNANNGFATIFSK